VIRFQRSVVTRTLNPRGVWAVKRTSCGSSVMQAASCHALYRIVARRERVNCLDHGCANCCADFDSWVDMVNAGVASADHDWPRRRIPMKSAAVPRQNMGRLVQRDSGTTVRASEAERTASFVNRPCPPQRGRVSKNFDGKVSRLR
jgi:hypothetical protein